MPNQIMMRGSIHITSSDEVILSILNDPTSTVMVVDMDEESDPRISKNHPRVLGGSCLLPPMEGLIAAADGEHEVFMNIYSEHFSSPFIDNYVSALLTFMMTKDGHIVLYYDDELGIIQYLIQIFWMRYGIQIGVIGESDFGFDPGCMPIWLQYLYRENRITPEDFMFNYPSNTALNPAMIDKLLKEFCPYGNTTGNMVSEIYKTIELLKQNPNTVSPLVWMGS